MNFLRKLLGAIQVSTVGLVQATPKAPMSDEELATGLTRFMELAWNLKDATKEAWGSISPVKVTTKFMGWGFVEGRREAFKINKRIAITEADDDMDFTEYCVLVDGVPCLLLKRKGSYLSVTIIAERDFLADVFNAAAMRCNTLEDFKNLAEPVQKIMHDIIQKTMEIQAARRKDDAVEKMLTY